MTTNETQTDFRFITWNLRGGNPRQLALVEQLVRPNTIIALQEASPAFVPALREWAAPAWLRCSFDLRAPKKYDGKNRELATVVAGTGDITAGSWELVPETLLPERTLAVTVDAPSGRFIACSFHALAGASFKAGKVLMFRALTRWLEEQTLPVIFGMDRNAPEVDHPDENNIEWKWPGETREPLLFGHGAPHGCRDAFRRYLETHPDELDQIRRERPRGPLAITYERGSGENLTACRYDAVYLSDAFRIEHVEHDYQRALDAGSDHGLVIVDVVFPRL